MCRTVSTVGMSREEWLRIRKGGIGGSDAGAICGLNPYSSPMNVYYDKTSAEISDYDNEAMRVGRDLEEYVARRFMEETGLKVRRSNKMYWSEEHPFLFADVDRLVVGEDAGLECKTASAYSMDKWKDGEIPPHYLMQCYHYMAVTGRKSWYIAAVILGVGFQYAKISWDAEVIGNLVRLETDFWENHVIRRIMPEPDGSSACDEVLDRCFPTAKSAVQVLPDAFQEKLERRMALSEQVEALELEKNRIDQEIKLAMMENEEAVSGRFKIRWSNVRTNRLDAKRMKAEKPELYRAFCTASTSRRFTVKAA